MKINTRYYWLVILILTLVTIVYFTIYKEDDKRLLDKKVVFGISPFQDTMMPYLGQVKGWYKAEGIDVEFKILGWTEIQEALSSNSSNKIDVGINNISSVVATHSKNPDLVYYYGFNTFDNGFALMIRPDGKLKPLKFFTDQGKELGEAIKSTGLQLKGKTVITTANTDMEQGVAAIATKASLDFLTDIKIINLNPDEGLAAFLSGAGDAYIGGIPQRTKAKDEGMIEMITGSNIGPAPINGLVTTKKFIVDNEEKLTKLLRVWFKIVQYTNKNIDESAKIIVGEMNKHTAGSLKVSDFKLFWNNYEHYPSNPIEIQNEILSDDGKNYWKKRWENCNYYYFDVKKIIPYPVNPNDAFYMIQAQEKLKKSYEK